MQTKMTTEEQKLASHVPERFLDFRASDAFCKVFSFFEPTDRYNEPSHQLHIGYSYWNYNDDQISGVVGDPLSEACFLTILAVLLKKQHTAKEVSLFEE